MRLELDGLTVRINGRSILSSVFLKVAAGEIVALLGRDGSGKTVCLEAICGLRAIDKGQLSIDGNEIAHLPEEERARLGLSYLPEQSSIFRNMTVAENIKAVLELTQSKPTRARRLLELLRTFDLESIKDQKASTLSGGERRRCEIARAMATRPKVLIMDEPLRGLDPMAVREVLAMMVQLRAAGVGLLISDYDLHDLLGVMDRAYLLDAGQIVFSGSPGALLKDPEVRKRYLGQSFSASASEPENSASPKETGAVATGRSALYSP